MTSSKQQTTKIWPAEYLRAIKNGDVTVSEKIKAVYEREVGWIENPPEDFNYVFNAKKGQRVIDFIERFCKHSKGKWSGRPVRLELFQKAKIQLVFGWIEKETGLRRIREVVDLRGRKCGKSVESACVGWYMLVADGEGGAEVYCVANKKDQASIVFNEAVNIRSQSPALKSITRKRQSDIYYEAKFSIFKALASDTSTMDGLSASMFIQDEPHAAKTRNLFDVMVQSQQARSQPIAWTISTNGFVREAYFDTLYEQSSHIALWDDGYQDYKTLALIHELDNRDEWKKPECWEKANPGLGKIKSRATLAANVEKAKRDPSFLPTVLTKDFNVPENSAEAWISYETAVNETKIDMQYVSKSYAIGGCDLSAVKDLTCATLLIKKPNDANFYVLQKYFLPKARIDAVEVSSKREAPYKLWAEQSWLHVCDGATVNFHDVTEWFAEMVRAHNIRPLWIGYDRALSGYWVPEMKDYGFDMEQVVQGPFTWTYPMKELGGLLEEHRVIYNDNPMLRWCLINTGKKSLNKDGIQSIQPVRTGTTKRIDGMVSLLNAFTCYKKHEDEYLLYVR